MPNPSPEHAALLVTRGIYENLDALSKKDPPASDEDVDSRRNQLKQLAIRGQEILVDEGHEDKLEEVFGEADRYFNRLLIRTMTTKFIDTVADSPNPAVRRVAAELVAKPTGEGPLTPPNLKEFAKKVREPFSSLLEAVGVIYMVHSAQVYQTSRDAANRMFGAFERPQQPPQA